ncbi:DUF3164 family protein [Campylobacter sp. RM12920]|uniref:DUF3164 family protein n=1 Tax=Campylobacter californiensis TaxID=1032243 RepID=A0ABD4JIR1_9BACT|nr:DUF3164 family protein [Campylobacter sp. RM12919]MBE2988987.1 DUF3164 family protein [Campylobacter sp. RM12920]
MAKLDEKGFWQNKEGNFVHPQMVPIDKSLEDELVEKLITKANELQAAMREFKKYAYGECESFMDMLKAEYGIDRLENSRLGNVTLRNFNGTNEVQIAISKQISFDKKLVLAKEKIDEYLDAKTESADPEIRTLITRAFDVKNGKVDAKQILSLKQYPIQDPKWKEAMGMIDEATEIVGTKSYIRFKTKDSLEGKCDLITLDFAAI